MAQSTEAGRRDVPVLPGGRRLPGHALSSAATPSRCCSGPGRTATWSGSGSARSGCTC